MRAVINSLGSTLLSALLLNAGDLIRKFEAGELDETLRDALDKLAPHELEELTLINNKSHESKSCWR